MNFNIGDKVVKLKSSSYNNNIGIIRGPAPFCSRGHRRVFLVEWAGKGLTYHTEHELKLANTTNPNFLFQRK